KVAMFIICWIASPMARNDNGDKKSPRVAGICFLPWLFVHRQRGMHHPAMVTTIAFNTLL
ncbi:MAG: hypothetical protein K2L94_00845, partial [Alphaproteobacteria bacterium]|nr:hypothetical protein [Alphaproteobacteria bacterium]